MRKSLLISLLILCPVIVIVAQDSIKESKTPYKFKKSQHTITYSPIAFIGYKYAYSFNPYLAFGVGLSIGRRTSDILNSIDEMVKVNFFYRVFISDKTYVNLGAFAAFEFEFQPYRGFEGEIFYGWEHIKIGHGIQLGYFDDQMSDHGGEEFMYSINLLILQVNL